MKTFTILPFLFLVASFLFTVANHFFTFVPNMIIKIYYYSLFYSKWSKLNKSFISINQDPVHSYSKTEINNWWNSAAKETRFWYQPEKAYPKKMTSKSRYKKFKFIVFFDHLKVDFSCCVKQRSGEKLEILKGGNVDGNLSWSDFSAVLVTDKIFGPWEEQKLIICLTFWHYGPKTCEICDKNSLKTVDLFGSPRKAPTMGRFGKISSLDEFKIFEKLTIFHQAKNTLQSFDFEHWTFIEFKKIMGTWAI